MQNRPDWEVQCEGLLQALPPEMEPICDSRGEVKDKIFVCIKGDRHDILAGAFLQIRNGDGGVKTTGVRQDETILIAHGFPF